MRTVKLSYFKPSGKWYSDGEMTVHSKFAMYEIWSLVRGRMRRKMLPGLIEGHNDFTVYVEVPDHPHNHPHLLFSEEQE